MHTLIDDCRISVTREAHTPAWRKALWQFAVQHMALIAYHRKVWVSVAGVQPWVLYTSVLP